MTPEEFKAEVRKKKEAPQRESRVILALPAAAIDPDIPEIIHEFDPAVGHLIAKVVTPDGRKIPVDEYCWNYD